MNTTLKYILIGLLVLAIIAILAFSNILKDIEVGAVFASIAGGFAAFRSKIFKSSSKLDDQLAQVEEEHASKRNEWKSIREEFDSTILR